MTAAAERAAARACGRWSGSPTGGCRPSPWPASWSPRAGSATVRHVRAQYLQDWIADEDAPLSWRLDKEQAGSGALGDIGAHVVDLAQHITGELHHRGQRADRDVRARAAGRRATSPGCTARRPAARRARPGHGRRRRGVHRAGSGGGAGDVRGDPVRHRPQERASGSRSTASRASLAFDFEDMNVLHLLDATEDAGDRRLPPDRGHRARAPVRRRVVAGRSRPGLRARLRPPGRRPGRRHRRRDAARRRRSPTACRSSACWPPSSTAPRASSIWHPPTDPDPAATEDPTWPDRSPCSPASGPTCRSRSVARLASEWGYDGLEIACWGDHLDVWRGAEDDDYIQGKLDLLERYGLQALRDLQPPQGPGGLRRPDRRAAPRHPARPHLGRRRPRGRRGSAPPRR